MGGISESPGSPPSSQFFLYPNNRPWAVYRKVMLNYRPGGGYLGGGISERPGTMLYNVILVYLVCYIANDDLYLLDLYYGIYIYTLYLLDLYYTGSNVILRMTIVILRMRMATEMTIL